MEKSVEIVANRVYFQVRSGSCTSGIHMDENDGFVYHFHCMDTMYRQVKIRKYFGPTTLSTIHRYCSLVDANLRYTTGRHLYYTNNSETTAYQQKRTNSIFLVGCYLILRKSWSPEKTQEKLGQLQVSIAPYTDMEGSTAHALNLLDCWKALYHGMVVHEWFQRRDTVKDIVLSDGSADIISWVVPEKLIALEDPKEPRCMGRGPKVRPAIVSFFKIKRVEAVVRLNSKDYEFRASYGQPYNSEEFISRAIKHYDMFFKDGGIPSETQVEHFLKLVKKARSPVAVHCHAGRGRTGTMLACSLIKFWGFEATEAIAWVRMCRVACIVGIQQDFLKNVEMKLKGPEAPISRKNTQKQMNKVNLQASEPTKESKATDTKMVSAHLRVRRRALVVKHGHRKSTRMRPKKIRSKSCSQDNVENVTVLPIDGALDEVRRARQSGKMNAQNQQRIVREIQMNTTTNKTCNSSIGKCKSEPQQEQQQKEHRSLNSHFDVKVLRHIHPILEQTRKKQLTNVENYHKHVGHVGGPPTTDSQGSPLKLLVEKPKSKGMEGILRPQIRTSVPYEMKETKRVIHDESSKPQAFKGPVRMSKSSIPFAKHPAIYSSSTLAMERLARLLSNEKDNRVPPVPSVEHRTTVNSATCRDRENVLSTRNSQSRCTKTRSAGEPAFGKGGQRLAWQEIESTPYNLVKTSRKESLVSHNDFLEKQRQAYETFEVAHLKLKGIIKRRDMRR